MAERQSTRTSKTCSVQGCNRPYRCKGYCSLHYKRVSEGRGVGPVGTLKMPAVGTCSVEDCCMPIRCKGLCGLHYERTRDRDRSRPQRQRCTAGACRNYALDRGYCKRHQLRFDLYGDTLEQFPLQEGAIPAELEIELRVMNNSRRLADGCIKFLGKNRNARGYASVGFQSRQQLVHRVIYTVKVGPIPSGLAPDGSDWTIDHLCRRVDCVNVEHMEVVSRRENVRRREVALGRKAEMAEENR